MQHANDTIRDFEVLKSGFRETGGTLLQYLSPRNQEQNIGDVTREEISHTRMTSSV